MFTLVAAHCTCVYALGLFTACNSTCFRFCRKVQSNNSPSKRERESMLEKECWREGAPADRKNWREGTSGAV